jgi:hypothetical protein
VVPENSIDVGPTEYGQTEWSEDMNLRNTSIVGGLLTIVKEVS